MSGVSEALHSSAAMSASQRCLAAGQRTLVRGLRSLAKAGSRAGQPGGLRLAGRPSTQQGAFSTSRVTCTASSAVTDNVETATQPAAGEAGAAAAAVGSAAKPFQSTAYPFTDIEAKWQAYWEEHKTFRTPEFHELDTSKPKFYALDMFPYPRWAGGWWLLLRLCWSQLQHFLVPMAAGAGGMVMHALVSGSSRQLRVKQAPNATHVTAAWSRITARLCRILLLVLHSGCAQPVCCCGFCVAALYCAPARVLHPPAALTQPPGIARTPPARHAAVPACTWATQRATPPPTSSPATSACAATMCCTPWGGTRLACRRSSTPSRRAPTLQ